MTSSTSVPPRSASTAANVPSNLAAYCLGAGQRTPDKVALEVLASVDAADPAERWTYRELDDAVRRIAGGLLMLGAPRGSRVLIRLDNVSLYPLTFLGAIAAGLIPIPTSSQLTDGEARFIAEDSASDIIAGAPVAGYAARHVLSSGALAEMMRTAPHAEFAATSADDPAYLIYTSGTTARPKGVVHAQRVLSGRAPMYDGWYGITPQDRMMHAGAFNWTYTLGTGLLDPWTVGATSLIYTGDKSPELWPRLINAAEATLFAAVPGLMRQILKYAPAGAIDFTTLRHGLIAGEKPPESLFSEWRQRTGTELFEALGMSELSTYISSAPTVPRKPGTIGKAQTGRTVAIISADDGEEPLAANEIGLIAVDRSDPGLMLGYWNRPDEEADVYRGRWFVGGDLGVIDEDGYVVHHGRANDVMKALGYRVSPQEVEATLAKCPGIADIACAEVRVREDVSIIAAFVILEPGEAISADDVRADVLAFAADNLAAYKRPRAVYVVDQFPRTANGKVKRNALAAIASAQTT